MVLLYERWSHHVIYFTVDFEPNMSHSLQRLHTCESVRPWKPLPQCVTVYTLCLAAVWNCNKLKMANGSFPTFNLKTPESIISLSLVVNSRHRLAINTTCGSPPMAFGDLVRTEWWMDGDQVLQWGKMSLTGSVGVSWVNEVAGDYLQVWLIQD